MDEILKRVDNLALKIESMAGPAMELAVGGIWVDALSSLAHGSVMLAFLAFLFVFVFRLYSRTSNGGGMMAAHAAMTAIVLFIFVSIATVTSAVPKLIWPEYALAERLLR